VQRNESSGAIHTRFRVKSYGECILQRGLSDLKTAEILVIGTGSIARGVVYGLSHILGRSFRVVILGRSPAKVSEIANARAASVGASVICEPISIAQFKAAKFSRVFRSLKPKVILLAASIQSPWEITEEDNGWTRLVAQGGFGITLPLQMALAVEVARAAMDLEAAVVNACYPDCVNVVLDHLGLRTTCGLGNAAIVEAFCRSAAGAREKDVRVLAHHGQLGPWLQGKAPGRQPRVWVRDHEVSAQELRPNYGAIGEELNDVTTSTAIPLLLSLLSGGTLRTSIPGVAKLPGGYPFLLRRGKFSLQLPSGITLEEAIEHNKRGERLDGLDVGAGVTFVGKARKALDAANFEYAQGFDLSEWLLACKYMTSLRDRLRAIR
jgi:hypothetical protein